MESRHQRSPQIYGKHLCPPSASVAVVGFGKLGDHTVRIQLMSTRLVVHQSLASLAPTYRTTDIHLVSKYGRRPLRSSTDRTLSSTNPQQIW